MTFSRATSYIYLLLVFAITGCTQVPSRENYLAFINSEHYSKIESKNVQCKNGVCDAYIVLVSPRETANYRYGVAAGQSTESTMKMRFFCNEHADIMLSSTERTLRGEVIASANYTPVEKDYIIPNSRGSSWEAYVCEGQKGYQSLD